MGEETTVKTPDEQLRQLFGKAEKSTANAMEELVHTDSFGEILARVTENVMGLTKIGFGVLDMTVRNLRIAGRADLIRLGRQLARNEDKLERVLQEVERLQDEVRELAQAQDKPPARRRGNSTSTRSNGSASSSSSKRRSGGSNGRSRSSGGSRASSSSSS
jgi:uncharacterized membrane protein YgcG